LVHKGTPIAGIIYAPYPGIVYYGSKETGILKKEGGAHLVTANNGKEIIQCSVRE
jgi:3'-phosphoadenosine 5'-phosphosulfate (PAPS) 3'-phosphatase